MDKVKLEDGNVILTRRGGTWMATIKTLDGVVERITCGKDRRDFKDAQAWAVQRFQDTNYRIRNGMVARTTKMKDIADDYLKNVELSPDNHRRYKSIYKNHIGPFFGNMDLDKISTKDLEEWVDWINHDRVKPLSPATMRFHATVLSNIFQYAKTNKWIAEKPTLPKGKFQYKRRPRFTDEEIMRLLDSLKYEAKNNYRSDAKETAQFYFYYVYILYFTGIRPGKEMDDLRWCDIDMNYKIENVDYVKITVHTGKTIRFNSTRERLVIIPRDFIGDVFDEMKKWHGKNLDKDLVFQMPSGRPRRSELFSYLLNKFKLRIDNNGDARSLYSIRHSFATIQTNNNQIKSLELAKHMGTSVSMLEKFYYHANPDNIGVKVAAALPLQANATTFDILKISCKPEKDDERQKVDK